MIVELCLSFVGTPAVPGTQYAILEAKDVLKQAGIDALFTDGANENCLPINVMNVSPAGWGLRKDAFGVYIAMDQHEVTGERGVVYVFLPNLVKCAVARQNNRLVQLRRFVRAMGRTMAHEVLHSVGVSHSEGGLMAASPTEHMMVGDKPNFNLPLFAPKE